MPEAINAYEDYINILDGAGEFSYSDSEEEPEESFSTENPLIHVLNSNGQLSEDEYQDLSEGN